MLPLSSSHIELTWKLATDEIHPVFTSGENFFVEGEVILFRTGIGFCFIERHLFTAFSQKDSTAEVFAIPSRTSVTESFFTGPDFSER